jgi:hypothetical protein
MKVLLIEKKILFRSYANANTMPGRKKTARAWSFIFMVRRGGETAIIKQNAVRGGAKRAALPTN